MRLALIALTGWLLGGCVLVPAPAPYAYPVHAYQPYYYRHWHGR